MKLRRNKSEERASKLLLSELPYFNFRGNLAFYHGQFNNSIPTDWWPRRSKISVSSSMGVIGSKKNGLDKFLAER